MLKTFRVLKEVNIDEMENFNRDLDNFLSDLDSGCIFDNNTYSQTEFKALLESFVVGQRDSLGRTKKGSWSIAPDDDGMPSDARVDFIFKPTYLVTAILTRALCDYPNIANSIPNFENALKKGMAFCSYRDLGGAGYDFEKGQIEALTILSMGKVPWFLDKHKEFCPKLLQVIIQVSHEMVKKLNLGTTTTIWGENLKEQFSSALETLYVKGDKEMYASIMSTGNDTQLFNEEDLPW